MPPTFPIFLGSIAYIGLLGLTGLICVPMLLFSQTRKQGKIILLTAIISFPILLIVGLTLTILFALPGLALGYVFHKLGIINLIGIFFLSFTIFIAASALYHWYLGYIMIKNYIHDKPLDRQIENDKVYSIFIKRVVRYFSSNGKTSNKTNS